MFSFFILVSSYTYGRLVCIFPLLCNILLSFPILYAFFFQSGHILLTYLQSHSFLKNTLNFFFLMATPAAYGCSQARDGVWALAGATRDSLHGTGEQTYTLAGSPAAVVRALACCTSAGTPPLALLDCAQSTDESVKAAVVSATGFLISNISIYSHPS